MRTLPGPLKAWRMKHILVPLDLKADTGLVLEKAVEQAHAFGAKLWLLHVAEPDPGALGLEPGPQYIRDMRAEGLQEDRAKLHRMVAELVAARLEAQPLVVMGPPAECILNEADRLRAGLIVMGAHGRRGLAKAFLGSTSDDVLRANRFPVLIVPTPAVP